MRRQVKKLLAASQRGMTLLEIMIVLAILALVMGLVVGPRVMRMFGKSKVDIAQLTVKKYAYEAFGEWSQAHPDKSCPDKLEDLTQYMDNKDVKDPWGNLRVGATATTIFSCSHGVTIRSRAACG